MATHVNPLHVSRMWKRVNQQELIAKGIRVKGIQE